jgi:hypothetical protein
MRYRLIFGFAAIAATLSGMTLLLSQQPNGARGPQQQATVGGGPANLPGKVRVTGENPGIRLLDKQGGTTLTDVNFWGVDWSPVGAGHVCFLTTGNGKGPNDLRIALYDNPKLVDYLAKDLMSTLLPNFVDPPYKPIQATFSTTGDSLTERRQFCKSEQYSVELVWRDFNEGSFGEMRPPSGFIMTFFVITSRVGEVYINGKKAPGNWYPSSFPASYLAYAETWRK